MAISCRSSPNGDPLKRVLGGLSDAATPMAGKGHEEPAIVEDRAADDEKIVEDRAADGQKLTQV